MTQRAPAALLAIVLAGCTPGTSPTPTAPGSPARPAATPSPEPTASPPPQVENRFEFGPAVVVDPELAGTTDKYVNPGAVIEVDGRLHMFPNLFSAWPGRVLVPHLTSEDGLTWTLDRDAAPLDSADLPMADPGIDVSTGYLAEDGTWVLIFETVSTTNPWTVWRATAPSPRGPWTIDEAPILPAGSSGVFDAAGVQWPTVVRVDDGWAIYYAGLRAPGRGTGSIGAAFSDDGVTWTKHDEAVLAASEPWEFRSLDRPRVVATPDGLVMLYAGLDLNQRALATSRDGITWTKLPGPIIEASDFPVAGRAWDSALLYRKGELELFLEIGGNTTRVFRATLRWP